MFRLGPWEIVLIVTLIIIVFGPKRLPELGKGIGQFLKNFKKSISAEEKSSTDDSKKTS